MSDHTNPSQQEHLSDTASDDPVLAGQDAASQRDPSAPAEDAAPASKESSQPDPPPVDEEVSGVNPESSDAEESDEDASTEETSVDADAAKDEDEAAEETAEEDGEDEEEQATREWYILKVQSNREKSTSDALRRRIKVEGLDEFFGDIVVPTEKVTEFKGGKKRIVRRKLYPGYIMVHMVINDETWFLVRETPGIGDFTGAGGKPTPMLPQEVQRIISKGEEKTDEAPKLKINFKIGDRVKINEGTFENFEGEVSSLDEASGHVTVMINIFGRSTPVQLEYWQIESL